VANCARPLVQRGSRKRREGIAGSRVYLAVAYRIVCTVLSGSLLLALSGCSFTVQSGPSSPEPVVVQQPAPVTTVYVPVSHAPANPRVVSTPAARPAPATPAAVPPVAQPPVYRPAGAPSLASDVPPATTTPRAPALPPSAVGHGTATLPAPVTTPPATTPPATTPPATTPPATTPPATTPLKPKVKGDPRTEKQPQSPPSVK